MCVGGVSEIRMHCGQAGVVEAALDWSRKTRGSVFSFQFRAGGSGQLVPTQCARKMATMLIYSVGRKRIPRVKALWTEDPAGLFYSRGDCVSYEKRRIHLPKAERHVSRNVDAAHGRRFIAFQFFTSVSEAFQCLNQAARRRGSDSCLGNQRGVGNVRWARTSVRAGGARTLAST